MKTKLSLALTGISIIIILDQFKFIDDVLFLFLVGAIPGTNSSVPPIFMMVVFITIATFLAIRINRYQQE